MLSLSQVISMVRDIIYDNDFQTPVSLGEEDDSMEIPEEFREILVQTAVAKYFQKEN